MRHVPRVPEVERSRQIRAWLAVALWIGVIAVLSGESYSAQQTGPWVRRIVRFFFPETPSQVLHQIHWLLRRGAHVTAYGVLALLALRAFRLSFPAAFRRHALAALLVVASVGAVDELHQSTTRTRTGSRGDVALDLVGGGAALVCLALARSTRRTERVQ
jgi:VanZ family protein